MNTDLYSNTEFILFREQLNNEIKRRGTYKWWGPLVPPCIGEDKTPPVTLPNKGQLMVLSDGTYTVNTPSELSMERTRNINYPAHGDNPVGDMSTSSVRFDVDEVKNLLIGLARIHDINLYYGRDEVPGTAFRNTKGLSDALDAAKNSKLNKLLHESDISSTKFDPLTGENVTYPIENGIHVMPSGEFDGEETLGFEGPNEKNFYDDHGAKVIPTGEYTPDGQQILVSNSDYKPMNPFVSPRIDRSWIDHDDNRNEVITRQEEGELPSSRFGAGPRNPNRGSAYKSRPVFGGVIGSCQTACTGLCYQTCDNQCSESCSTTCWDRCGNACTSTCGNICTGCTTMCYTSCKTKCENSTGYSCLNVGAQTVRVTKIGNSEGESGEPGSSTWPQNKISFTTYKCQGCAYTCQFYPNKRTTCWDAGCQSLCFTSCRTNCSTSCFGGCIDNKEEGTGRNYKSGKGRGCSGGCTVNCVGTCHQVCEGECVNACYHACKATCHDNCEWKCFTMCGSGCMQGCMNGCTGCSSCAGTCEGETTYRGCVGCGALGGCASTCQHDCNKNCIGWGCRSICGIESAGACESNCRLNCMSASCTSLCSDACSSRCTSCANNCGVNCGPCTSQCSVGCGAACNVTCTERCEQACVDHCNTSCTDSCGGCSNLCYSCVGMCIGVCSVKCENGCSSCAKNCSMWCDSSCNRECFSNCSDRCISSCSGSCITYLQSQTNSTLPGAERPPIAEGFIYPNPTDRYQERESFRLYSVARSVIPDPVKVKKEYLIEIIVDKSKANTNDMIRFKVPDGLDYCIKQTTLHGGVFIVDNQTGEIEIIPEACEAEPEAHYKDDTKNIFIVILYHNPGISFTSDDILVELPVGFTHFEPVVNSNGDTIIVIERLMNALEYMNSQGG